MEEHTEAHAYKPLLSQESLIDEVDSDSDDLTVKKKPVKKQYYRLPEGTLELAKISKVLMAMEQGRVTEFEGKSLDQIQIEPEGRAMHPMVVAVPLLNV
uniref:Uncharacterized protein n=1 Tax=Knipowitschia caucasica TaxID=637954 RepID=A0AAV2K6R4_KNICA